MDGPIVTRHPASGFNPPASAQELSPDCILLTITVIFLFVTEVTLFTFGALLIPPLPDISVVSGSAAIHNATAEYIIQDLDVGFTVSNSDLNGMIFKNITLLTYHEKDRLSTVALPPFEQAGEDHNTLWFKVKDVVVPIDWWADIDDCLSKLRFKLTARVRYVGRAWSRQEIPVKVDCHQVTIRFDPTTGILNTTQLTTPNFDTGHCDVRGLWNNLRSLLADLMLIIPIAYIVLGYLVLLLLVKFGVLSPEMFQHCVRIFP